MSSKSYGLVDETGAVEFSATRDSSGRYSGTRTWTAPRGRWESTLKSTFVRGAGLPSLDNSLPAYWNFLELESVQVFARPGGFVEIVAEFLGFNEAEFESDRDSSYTLTGTRVQADMLNHPLFRSEVPLAHRRLIAAAAAGEYAKRESMSSASLVTLYHVPTAGAESDQTITTATGLKWYNVIIEEGNRTYLAPSLEWTCSRSNISGLTDSSIAPLGLKDTPSGNPPQPFFGDREWMLISSEETRGAGAVETSQTWQLSPPGGLPFWYKYNPSEIDPYEGDGSS